jgi:hypothetical protein
LEKELLELLLPLGVGGALAGFIFYFYRQDRKESEKDRSRMTDVCERNATAGESLSRAIDGLSASVERADHERARQFSDLMHTLMVKRERE